MGLLEAELFARLERGARVLKQHRGHSGIGVWRVSPYPEPATPEIVVAVQAVFALA